MIISRDCPLSPSCEKFPLFSSNYYVDIHNISIDNLYVSPYIRDCSKMKFIDSILASHQDIRYIYLFSVHLSARSQNRLQKFFYCINLSCSKVSKK